MSVMYRILLNNDLKKHLLALTEKEKKRIREKFEFLQNGIWDNGVKVKKLKSISKKVIFEARVDKGNRLIFTLGHHQEETAIYIWGLYRHDDVLKNAVTVVPDNAPFLNFEAATEEEAPEFYLDTIQPDYFTQEDIEEEVSDDYGPQKWLVLNETEWERLLTSGQSADELEFHLFLTSEQALILQEKPPVLLSGTAGSGKTTISVYSLFNPAFLAKRRLFLTYNQFLKNFSEKIYQGLIKNTHQEKSVNPPDFFVFKELIKKILNYYHHEVDPAQEADYLQFCNIVSNHRLYSKYDVEHVYREIHSVIKGARPAISAIKIKKFIAKFNKNELSSQDIHLLTEYLYWLKNFNFFKRVEAFIEKRHTHPDFESFLTHLADEIDAKTDTVKLFFDELFKVVDKKTNSFSEALLTLDEYHLLGKKRAPNFQFDRSDIYEIAVYYQEYLKKNRMVDELDLCKKAIELLEDESPEFKYDYLVCDEVQDFSDVQLYLIFKLVNNPRHLLLAGDPKQLINPSEFRWEEVKEKFYERGIDVPDIHSLNLNFRSVGSIVKLANALIDLKQRFIGLAKNELKEKWKFNGRPPFLIYGEDEDRIMSHLKGMSAGSIILTRNDNERNFLKQNLRTELIFTINEAKGLEFENVLVWKFLDDKKSRDLWRRISSDQYFDPEHFPHLRYEINLLYVAVTRARNTLVFYDGPSPAALWEVAEISDLVFKTDDQTILKDIWLKISSPAEWERQGDYFLEREYYAAAVECYRNAGHLEKIERTEAFLAKLNHEYEKAAVLFEKYKNLKEAALCYEFSRHYEKAIELWKKLKEKKRAQICRIRLYEQKHDYISAADEWEKLGEMENALKNWEKSGNHAKIAGYFFTRKNYTQAAGYYEKAKNYAQAALCYLKIKQYEPAAAYFYKTGNYIDAIKIYRRLKDIKMLLSCYLNMEDYFNAADISIRLKDYPKAVEYYTLFFSQSKDNKQILLTTAEKSRGLKAAMLYEICGKYKNAGAVYYQENSFTEALRCFEHAKDRTMLLHCYRKLKMYYEAAIMMENDANENDQYIIEHNFFLYCKQKPELFEKRKALLFKEAEDFFIQKDYQKALNRFKAIDETQRIIDCYFLIEDHQNALTYFINYRLSADFEKYLAHINADQLTPEAVESILNELMFYEDKSRLSYDNQVTQYYLILKLLVKALDNSSAYSKIEAYSLKFIDNSFGFIFNYYKYQKGQVNLMELYLELKIKIKKYNKLFQFVNLLRTNMNSDIIVQLLEKFRQDEFVNIIYYYLQNDDTAKKLLADKEINEDNYFIFWGLGEIQKTLEFLEIKNMDIQLISLSESIKRYSIAAKTQEKLGRYKAAGKNYLKDKKYDEALNCFKKIDDQAGIADVYEKMGQYDQALRIWKKLGNITRREKLMRLMKKKDIELKQLNLFDE